MPRYNKCPNPSLANNVTGWSISGGTGGRTAVSGFARPWAMQGVNSTYIQGPAVVAAATQVWDGQR